MKRGKTLVALTLALCLILLASVALAQPLAFNLATWTVDSGGRRSEGPGYILSGSIGQPDAGSLSGGVYTLSGGFWGGGVLAPPTWRVCLPLTVK